MPKPDNELINEFRKKFGDLLLTGNGNGRGGAGIDAHHVMEIDPLDTRQPDMSEMKLGLPGNSLLSHTFDGFGSLCPTPIGKRHAVPLDPGFPGSGAVFHNEAGDLHSPMIQWESTTAPLPDTSTRNIRTNPWAGSGFVPLFLTQHWMCENTSLSTQAHRNLNILIHHNTDYVTRDCFGHDPSTNNIGQHLNTTFDPGKSEAIGTEGIVDGNEEKYAGVTTFYELCTYLLRRFHYSTTLEAPTAMLWHSERRPVTYLNKGQTYTLKVRDSQPPVKDTSLVKYRTFVRVSFEEQDQRSDPVASWQLWKEGRGLQEADQRQSALMAVEYVDLFRDNASSQINPQIWLEKTYVDGFCVTWTANQTTNLCEVVIPLRFNFLSTDFSRSKGVKGVPVRLCAKTKFLRPEGEKGTMECYSEICYCVLKLFRDHGAERKLANDAALVKKKIEKLNKQIADELQTISDSIGPRHNFSSKEPCQPERQHQRRKRSIKRRGSQTIDDLHQKLARTRRLLVSARPVTILGLRGTEQDDPDLHPGILPRITSSSDTSVLSTKASSYR
jgi:hypothetical protein